MKGLLGLTPRETEIACLYLVDARPAPLIAEWLGVHEKTVRQAVMRAERKCPALRRLRRQPATPRLPVRTCTGVGIELSRL